MAQSSYCITHHHLYDWQSGVEIQNEGARNEEKRKEGIKKEKTPPWLFGFHAVQIFGELLGTLSKEKCSNNVVRKVVFKSL